ncbi:TlpA family protein disulfide reductase [Telmatobacter bradus]|uniref:TlpA family protein disulfide reductase n=1 Tax=Telmatobacter bradus TaxID=474953 RepID=UPI003B42B457
MTSSFVVIEKDCWNGRRNFLRVAVLLYLLIVCAGLSHAQKPQPMIGSVVPDFERSDLHGNRVRVSVLRGHVVLLNFWATWCAPCQQEMPVFVEWQKKYAGQGLQILGVSMDDDDRLVRKLATRLQINYPLMMADKNLLDSYGEILGLPVTLLVDRKGVIRARFEGETHPTEIEKQLRQLLAESSA